MHNYIITEHHVTPPSPRPPGWRHFWMAPKKNEAIFLENFFSAEKRLIVHYSVCGCCHMVGGVGGSSLDDAKMCPHGMNGSLNFFSTANMVRKRMNCSTLHRNYESDVFGVVQKSIFFWENTIYVVRCLFLCGKNSRKGRGKRVCPELM